MGRKPGKKSLKVTKFDKAVAAEIMKGNASLSEIEKKLSVASSAFNARLEELIQNGFFIREGEALKLGLKGFEAFYKLEKPKLVPLKPMEEDIAKKTGEENKLVEQNKLAEQKTRYLNEEKEIQTQQTQSQQQKQPQQYNQPQQLNTPSITTTTRVDLHDLLKKGAPTAAQEEKTATRAAEARQSIPAPQNQKELTELLQAKQQAQPQQTKELVVGGEAVCELCRTPFKLGANGNPKYGHCFCGAAYHKDCYEAALDATGECARCGRKLDLRMDKKSVEAVKELKELF